MTQEISKKLSANDVGDTGGHQAGILVPREPRVLAFFPMLGKGTKNPRLVLTMREVHSGERWDFPFIYYNNKFFGGTRNEYRLTHMTKFFRSINAKVGDELVFFRDTNLSYLIKLVRASSTEIPPARAREDGVLVLSGGWKVINV